MRERSSLPNVAMLETVASKSKSNPSTTASPKGRRAELLESGPKVSQINWAPAVAASVEVNPPSEYVAPPIERRIVLPAAWHVLMSSLEKRN